MRKIGKPLFLSQLCLASSTDQGDKGLPTSGRNARPEMPWNCVFQGTGAGVVPEDFMTPKWKPL
jgi:hypothetical protein